MHIALAQGDISTERERERERKKERERERDLKMRAIIAWELIIWTRNHKSLFNTVTYEYCANIWPFDK